LRLISFRRSVIGGLARRELVASLQPFWLLAPFWPPNMPFSALLAIGAGMHCDPLFKIAHSQTRPLSSETGDTHRPVPSGRNLKLGQ